MSSEQLQKAAHAAGLLWAMDVVNFRQAFEAWAEVEEALAEMVRDALAAQDEVARDALDVAEGDINLAAQGLAAQGPAAKAMKKKALEGMEVRKAAQEEEERKWDAMVKALETAKAAREKFEQARAKFEANLETEGDSESERE